MVKIRTADLVANISFILYFIVTIADFFAKFSIIEANISRLIIGTFIVLFTIISNGYKAQAHYIVYIIAYTIAGSLSYIYNSNMDVQELLWPFGFMSISLLFINFGLSFKLTKLIFYTFCLLVIMAIIQGGGIDHVILNGSRNGVGVNVILFFTILVITAYQQKKTVSFLVPLLSLLVCIMAIGRSGILTCTFMMIAFLLFKFSEGNIVRRKIWVLPLTFLIVAFITFIIYRIAPEFFNSAIRNFQNRGMESVRSQIWLDYLQSVTSSIPNFLFGASISGTNLLNTFNENLHNSFLMLHAKYGIVGFVITISLIVKCIVFLVKTRNGFLLIPLLLIIFRMNFDYTNFNGPLDAVLMFYMMFPYYKDLQRSKVKINLNEMGVNNEKI